MTIAAAAFVHGPAVVIDDRVNDPDNPLQAILKQLEDAQIPTLKLVDIPVPETATRWRHFGLIVLDWEFTYGSGDGDVEIPAGIAVPTGMLDESRRRNIAFIQSLLDETALPVFIASNLDPGVIQGQLETELPGRTRLLNERVHVFRKNELEKSLFEPISAWLVQHPSIQALQAWQAARQDAEVAVFHQFSEAEEDWVVSVQRAASADGASFDVTLRELLANNVVNRIGPLGLKLPEPSSDPLSDAAALRRVLHFSAVVPNASLDATELGTGDLFVQDGGTEPFHEIRIVLTPDCDLLRNETTRLTYVTAIRHTSAVSPNSAKRVKSSLRPDPLHLITCVLTADGAEHRIALRNWSTETVAMPAPGQPVDAVWTGYRRIGRLLDPYLTHVQQNFALTAIRKGLPRLPDDFFEGWT